MPDAPRPALPQSAPQTQTQLTATQDSLVSGRLAFSAVDGGVQVTGEISGLTPGGEFGFHVHENGDCSAADASSAGEHFNPDQHPHGHPQTQARHLGDLPNLKADDQGIAQVAATVTGASLGQGGAHDLQGRAVVVHTRPDDYQTQPAGDSGERLACGVISFLQPSGAP